MQHGVSKGRELIGLHCVQKRCVSVTPIYMRCILNTRANKALIYGKHIYGEEELAKTIQNAQLLVS